MLIIQECDWKVFKPNFWKPENPGKGLCKLLKEKAEKGARGENDALMKKGLRRC